MNWWKVASFEIWLQRRRRAVWLYAFLIAAFSVVVATQAFLKQARSLGYFFNGPFVTAGVTVIAGMLGLVAIAGIAADAATRDMQSRFDAIADTFPVAKASLIGGRVVAALLIALAVMSVVPFTLFIVAHLPGLGPQVRGPFRLGTYLGTFLTFALPSVLSATAICFAIAFRARTAAAAFVAAAVLFLISAFSSAVLAERLGSWTLAKLADPLGFTILSELSRAWTPQQKGSAAIALGGALLLNRVLWMAIGAAALAVAMVRGPRRITPARRVERPVSAAIETTMSFDLERAFGRRTSFVQWLTVARASFRVVVRSRAFVAVLAIAVALVAPVPELMRHLGVPFLPTTFRVTSVLGHSGDHFWLIIPLITFLLAGELVWADRDTRFATIADAMPVRSATLILGKFAGLSGALIVLQTVVLIAGVVTQLRTTSALVEPILHLQVLFGLQLPDLILFAALAVAVHAIVDHKIVSYIVLALVLAATASAQELRPSLSLLAFGSDLGWYYSEMTRFGGSISQFIWFKAYWSAWSVLLLLGATLLVARGVSLPARLRMGRAIALVTARQIRLGSAALLSIGACAAVILCNIGGASPEVLASGRARYEKRYKRFEQDPQPSIARVALDVELFPERCSARIHGRYVLENRTAVPIREVHVVGAEDVDTVVAGPQLVRLLVDAEAHYSIYTLVRPLEPGESMPLVFDVSYTRRGFESAASPSDVITNATRLTSDVLPVIGYRRSRELVDAGDRQRAGLPRRAIMSDLDDAHARADRRDADPVAFEATIGTARGEVAVAPGSLRRSWHAGSRSYFRYVADRPIRNAFAVYSSRYEIRRERWRGTSMEVFSTPRHADRAAAMVRSMRDALDFCAAKVGDYPYAQLRLVEVPGSSVGLHSDPINIRFSEGFAELDGARDGRGIDLPAAVLAHEVAHQWWGNQLTPAPVEGAPVLTESIAWYSAFGAYERARGKEESQRLVEALRKDFLDPHVRAEVPLLRAADWFSAYRRGPFALIALREMLGAERFDAALRSLFASSRRTRGPLPTTRDLEAELIRVAPPELQPRVRAVFEGL